MNIIIHDLTKELFEELFSPVNRDTKIISNTGHIQNCIGCFGCWVKTPGKCVIKDGYENMGVLLSQADHVIIISRCYYGGYSPLVKSILDRSISYLLRFFRIKHGETHHKQRYQNKFRLSVYFYGSHITPEERKTARKLVQANRINFHVPESQVFFFPSVNQISREVIFQ